MKVTDGGSAFPRSASKEGPFDIQASRGMTLRDWFAGQALALINSDDFKQPLGQAVGASSEEASKNRIAKRAYEIADAMIKAREKEA